MPWAPAPSRCGYDIRLSVIQTPVPASAWHTSYARPALRTRPPALSMQRRPYCPATSIVTSTAHITLRGSVPACLTKPACSKGSASRAAALVPRASEPCSTLHAPSPGPATPALPQHRLRPPARPRPTLNLFSWNMDSASSRDTTTRWNFWLSLTAWGSNKQGRCTLGPGVSEKGADERAAVVRAKSSGQACTFGHSSHAAATGGHGPTDALACRVLSTATTAGASVSTGFGLPGGEPRASLKCPP